MPLVDRDYGQACLHSHIRLLNVVSEGRSVVSKRCQDCGFTPEGALFNDSLPLFSGDAEDPNLLENPAGGTYRIAVGEWIKVTERPCREAFPRCFKDVREVISYYLVCLIEKFHGFSCAS